MITDELYKSPESQYDSAVDLSAFMELASSVKKPFIQGSENFNPRIPGGAPANANIFEVFYGGNNFNPSASVDPSHQDHLHLGSNKATRIGKYLQGLGFRVSENPAFGSVSPTAHVENSYHYRKNKKGQGMGIDVSYDPGQGQWGSEQKALDWLERWLVNTYG